MTPPHHVERISCLFQPLLLEPQLFSLNLKISHSSFRSGIPICPKLSISHILQSGGLSYRRCKKIAFPLCFFYISKLLRVFLLILSPKKRPSSSGQPICKHLRFFRHERRYIAATFISLSNQILSVTQFFYISRHRRRHQIVPHLLFYAYSDTLIRS